MTISERIQFLCELEEICFHTYDEAQLKHPKLLDETRYALVEYGLPDSSRLGLNFYNYEGKSIPTVSEYFNLGPSWSTEDKVALDNNLVIGFNGSGDPVCIDLANNNELVFLNHDNDFQPNFINTSIQQFLECLLLLEEVRRMNNKPDFEEVLNQFIMIDSECVWEGDSWYSEINYLVHGQQE